MGPHKKKPFSGKAKKAQMLSKRQNKAARDLAGNNPDILLQRSEMAEEDREIQKINYQPNKPASRTANRYTLKFKRETDLEVQTGKEEASKVVVPLPPECLELGSEEYFPPGLKFPVRQEWSFSMSRDQLNAKENQYFTAFVDEIEENFDANSLSHFELNLETWRQLWRVLEMSDILLVIVDIRFASMMFPPLLYDYITKDLGKSIILILNKIDLAPAPVTVAWKAYLKEKFPDMEILTFTSFPSYNMKGEIVKDSGYTTKKRKGRLRMAAEGAQKLYEACKTIVNDEVDISSWETKIKEEMNYEYEDDEDEKVEIGSKVNLKSQDSRFHVHKKYEGGILTIGCIGQPNVGKSSLMNSIMGKKVVSVSKTPGHTKHFQTIMLTDTVKLCDCPGLVFPSKVPKLLQVLMGSYPIAQLRDPYSSIKFIAERVDLVKVLNLTHPENDEEWSTIDMIDGWALKRKFYTARTGRLDTHRAANNILRFALEGTILVCMRPPNYTKNEEQWKTHPEVKEVEWVLAKNAEAKAELESDYSSDDYSDDDEVVVKPNKFTKLTQKAGPSKSDDSEEDEDDDDDETEESEEEVRFSSNKFSALSND